MLIETTALLAILLEAPEAQELLARVNSAKRPVTSVISAVDAVTCLGKAIDDLELARRLVREFLEKAGIEIVSVPAEIYEEAALASFRYGTEAGHPAGLDLKDCFSYALSKKLGLPLAYTARRFSLTDVSSS